jgi:regulatory protein
MQRRRPKKTEDEARVSTLTPEQVRGRIFQRAAKLLAAKARSVAELRERLMESRGATEAIVDVVIARLSEYGYLDDERFAIGYASAKLRQRPIGRQRLQRDLSFKQVERMAAADALDKVFAEVSEEELIDRAIAKRIRVRGRPGTRAEAKSLFDHLLRQGFPFELVSAKVRAAARTDLDEDAS